MAASNGNITLTVEDLGENSLNFTPAMVFFVIGMGVLLCCCGCFCVFFIQRRNKQKRAKDLYESQKMEMHERVNQGIYNEAEMGPVAYKG